MKNLACISLLSFLFLDLAFGKIYERCQLARELKYAHKLPFYQLATWVCIAKYESSYNTATISPPNALGDKDYGIFQINDRYWCSHPGKGCKIPCSSLRDNNISDDVICAKKIYAETARLKGDGFKAWRVYETHCSGLEVQKFLKGCF